MLYLSYIEKVISNPAVCLFIGFLTSVLLEVVRNKLSERKRIRKKQKKLFLKMIVSLNELIDNLPNSKEDVQQFYDYLGSKKPNKKSKSEQVDEMIYLNDDIVTTVLAAYVFPQEYLREKNNKDIDFDFLHTMVCAYRNTLIDIGMSFLKINVKHDITKKQNIRFEKLLKYHFERMKS